MRGKQFLLRFIKSTIFSLRIIIFFVFFISAFKFVLAAPAGETCGYHALPCCSGAQVGSTCHDGSTCMPNQYCVFPVGYTPSPTPTIDYSFYPTNTPAQAVTPTNIPSILPTSAPLVSVMPTLSTNANCGSGGQSCCAPIRLIQDPRQSQAQTSREGYCYIPYYCSSGVCTIKTNTPAPTGISVLSPTALPGNYQSGSSGKTTKANQQLPVSLEKLIQKSGGRYDRFAGRFTLTEDVSLPLCPDSLGSLGKDQSACILFK